jgi:hypothetical protein
MHKIRVYTAACGAILLTALTVAAAAQQDKLASGAERTGQTLERIRAEPLALRDFLKRMPKGADLHSHLMPRRIFAMRLPTGYAWIRTPRRLPSRSQ